MTTPEQPGDDLKVEPEVIEDLDVTGDDADAVAGGVNDPEPITKSVTCACF